MVEMSESYNDQIFSKISVRMHAQGLLVCPITLIKHVPLLAYTLIEQSFVV